MVEYRGLVAIAFARCGLVGQGATGCGRARCHTRVPFHALVRQALPPGTTCPVPLAPTPGHTGHQAHRGWAAPRDRLGDPVSAS